MDSQGHIHQLSAKEMREQETGWEKMARGHARDMEDEMEEMEKGMTTPLMAPITEEEEKTLKLQSLPRRKNYMKNQPCPCGSGEKFKKCCWSKAAKFGMKP